MCYCVPVLVSLGCIQYEVLLVGIVAERAFVCGMMENANVAPAVHETTTTTVCKLND